MNGKERCKILKQIRKDIADANDIAYTVDECPHKGDCLGTCPKCESDVRYIEEEIAKRKRAGLAVTIAGIAAVPMLMTGCTLPGLDNDRMDRLEGATSVIENINAQNDNIEILDGEVAIDEPNCDDGDCIDTLDGDVAFEPDTELD